MAKKNLAKRVMRFARDQQRAGKTYSLQALIFHFVRVNADCSYNESMAAVRLLRSQGRLKSSVWGPLHPTENHTSQ